MGINWELLKYGSNYLKASDGAFFRGIAGFEADSSTIPELTYINMNADFLIRGVLISPTEDRLADLSMDWIHIGSTQYFDSLCDVTGIKIQGDLLFPVSWVGVYVGGGPGGIGGGVAVSSTTIMGGLKGGLVLTLD
ncbi:hypothetical protein [uncultured Eudoraea sp.]|uniref:hypothetical protein n=1 Tax=uncultured Eudoraea sp. TaxID=1035614 RepID=UPI002629A6A5|nr:hypothetical protein [uncultured Eudoraea sp.]